MDELTYESEPQAKDAPKKRRSFFGKLMRRPSSDLSLIPQTGEKDSELDTIQNSSHDSLPPLSDLNLLGYKDCSRYKLMDQELAANIRSLLPARLQLYDDWELIYSLEQHGVSLNTLYRNCSPEFQKEKARQKKGTKHNHGYAENVVQTMVSFGSSGSESSHGSRPHGYIMVIQDEKRNKFGCFLNEHLKPNEFRRYYGNGECFLWKCEWYDKEKLAQTHQDDPQKLQRFKAFMYTGINDNIIYSNHEFIAIGSSSGNNGLWVDKSLYQGVSYPCDTFGNEILNEHGVTGNKMGKFKIISLEIWRVGNLAQHY